MSSSTEKSRFLVVYELQFVLNTYVLLSWYLLGFLSARQKTNTGNYSYSISTITETGPGWLSKKLVSALNYVP